MWKLFTDECSIQISKDNIKLGKGRGVSVLDRKHYIEKCLNILELDQSKKLEKIQ